MSVQLPANLPPVLADQQRMAQVLVNLVGNAAKFSPVGTTITITATQVDGFVQVDVCDDGIGIPIEEREMVFEAFRQAKRDHPSQQQGAGLGLAICKGVVEAHCGNIWIADHGTGTKVSFTLPIAY
jgi:signal transduction histidine kinase